MYPFCSFVGVGCINGSFEFNKSKFGKYLCAFDHSKLRHDPWHGLMIHHFRNSSQPQFPDHYPLSFLAENFPFIILILITYIIRIIVWIIRAHGLLRHRHHRLRLIVLLIIARLVVTRIGILIWTCFVVILDFHPPVWILSGNFGDNFVALVFVGSNGYKAVAEFVELALGVSLFDSMWGKKIT